MLEFDHIEAVARGGEATAENVRLRCRAHNQHAAECTFGSGFMSDKRAEARLRAAARTHANRARAGAAVIDSCALAAVSLRANEPAQAPETAT
jgi:hypothetical protein